MLFAIVVAKVIATATPAQTTHSIVGTWMCSEDSDYHPGESYVYGADGTLYWSDLKNPRVSHQTYAHTVPRQSTNPIWAPADWDL